MELLALEHLRHCVFRHQPHKIIGCERAHPPPVEIDHGFLRIENLEHLRLVRLRILLDLLAAQRWTRSRAPRRIADHPGEIADQKDGGMPEILKVLQLAQHNGVAEMQIGRSRVHPQLNSQRLARSPRLLQLCAQFSLANNFRGALLEVSQLLIDRCEV
jgi:hypothetical protein